MTYIITLASPNPFSFLPRGTFRRTPAWGGDAPVPSELTLKTNLVEPGEFLFAKAISLPGPGL